MASSLFMTVITGLGTTLSPIIVYDPLLQQPTSTTYNATFNINMNLVPGYQPGSNLTISVNGNIIGNTYYTGMLETIYFFGDAFTSSNPGTEYSVFLIVTDTGPNQNPPLTTNIIYFNITIADVCIHPSMKIETSNGIKMIKDIVKGDLILDYKNDFIEVLFNIITGPTDKFYIIRKDLLGHNTPNEKFLIHGDHPILYDNKEYTPKNLMTLFDNIKEYKIDKPVKIYSLCTKERTFFKINGNICVCSWEEKEFYNYANKTQLIYKIK